VDSGLALDCQGDPIHVPQPQKLVLDEGCDPNLKGPLWVVLCGTEKCCAPRAAMCESDEDESPPVCTRERDWFEIRIVRAPPRCTCGCPEPGPKSTTQNLPGNECRCVNPEHTCYAAHYAGKCGCDCEDCADGDCDCVLLARLDQDKDKDPAGQPVWTLDHRVRRFVRPVLMRDPQVWSEEQARKKDKDKKGEDEKEEESGATDGHKEEPPGALAEAGQAPAAAPPATAPGRPDTEILKRTRRRDHG
jgi:hypothetical protein